MPRGNWTGIINIQLNQKVLSKKCFDQKGVGSLLNNLNSLH